MLELDCRGCHARYQLCGSTAQQPSHVMWHLHCAERWPFQCSSQCAAVSISVVSFTTHSRPAVPRYISHQDLGFGCMTRVLYSCFLTAGVAHAQPPVFVSRCVGIEVSGCSLCWILRLLQLLCNKSCACWQLRMAHRCTFSHCLTASALPATLYSHAASASLAVFSLYATCYPASGS